MFSNEINYSEHSALADKLSFSQDFDFFLWISNKVWDFPCFRLSPLKLFSMQSENSLANGFIIHTKSRPNHFSSSRDIFNQKKKLFLTMMVDLLAKFCDSLDEVCGCKSCFFKTLNYMMDDYFVRRTNPSAFFFTKAPLLL